MAQTRQVAKALILDTNSDFLLLKRSDTHPKMAGFYDLPGGMIEPNEDYGTGLVREVMEETGIELTQHDIRVLYSTTILMNERSYPTILYLVRLADEKPTIALSWEHQSYEWAPLSRLPEVEPHLAPTYRQALEYIRTNNVIEDIDIT